MDVVPYKFVDSVVELFDGEETLDPLANEVRNPLWKAVVDVHYRNREYYDVYVRVTKGGTKAQLATRKNFTEIYGNLESIQKNSRFARINRIDDLSLSHRLEMDNFQLLTKADAVKQLKTVLPYFELGSVLVSTGDLSDGQRIILPTLFNRVSLRSIYLTYHGQITLDFLKDQINNSPYLEMVHLYGDKWPKSVLPLVESFCLKGRPGKLVSLWMTETTTQVIDMRFVQKLFDHWEVSRNLNFSLSFNKKAIDHSGRTALLNQGRVLEITPAKFYNHSSSIGAFLSLGDIWCLEFRSCEVRSRGFGRSVARYLRTLRSRSNPAPVKSIMQYLVVQVRSEDAPS
uniref:F-box domain-containing protein n=1 Tax=Steinernema glaseri TaxID=37863 RepID=A0A1I7YZV5_9BILA